MIVSVVRTSENRYGVQVENPNAGYRQIFGSYDLDDDGLTKAQNDAADWVAKYKAAGIAAELQTVEVPMRRRYRDEDEDVEVRRAAR